MTPEQINAAIAESCGWIIDRDENGLCRHWISPKHGRLRFDAPPDYANDLNAMHEAEDVIGSNQFHGVNYPHEVFKATTGMEWKGDMGYFFPTVIRATAIQRAEAFLKTINKWQSS